MDVFSFPAQVVTLKELLRVSLLNSLHHIRCANVQVIGIDAYSADSLVKKPQKRTLDPSQG